jgi:hypothetical protein
MELSGDLSDFALADILQILALSRKSGVLFLDSGHIRGRITIDSGKIVQASIEPGGKLSDRLIREGLISSDWWGRAKGAALGLQGIWTLKSLICESGAMSEEEFDRAACRHIREVVGALLGLEKGRFGIILNRFEEDPLEDHFLGEGLEVGEVLLEAAKESDEARRNLEREAAARLASELGDTELSRGGAGHRSDRTALLCSLLVELRSYSFEAEVSLLVMRYASEIASRGVLFVVRGDEIWGLGQFGVEPVVFGKTADESVREIRIPLGANTIFDDVVRHGKPFIGRLPEGYWYSEMLSKIGGNGMPLHAFALPLICNGRPVFVFYGDNYPGYAELQGVDELVALVNQASLVLEKIVLERLLSQLGH